MKTDSKGLRRLQDWHDLATLAERLNIVQKITRTGSTIPLEVKPELANFVDALAVAPVVTVHEGVTENETKGGGGCVYQGEGWLRLCAT